MEIKYFANPNLTMELHGTTASYRYKFQDFRGGDAVPSPWEALIETRCQTWNTSLNVGIPHSTNTKDFNLIPGDLRWINRVDDGPREKTVQLCKSSTDDCPRFNNIIPWLRRCTAVLTGLTAQGCKCRHRGQLVLGQLGLQRPLGMAQKPPAERCSRRQLVLGRLRP